MPTIENDQIQFVRNYNYEPANNKIAFETILHIKANGEKIRNIIKLFPIRRDALDALLKKAGFNEISYFGNFKGSRSDDESIPLVISAQK